MLVNGWHANHIFGNWIITEMLFLEFASVGPMLGQADISTLAQRRTNGWITIGMFTGSSDDSGIAIEDADSEYLLWSGFTARQPICN